MVLILSSLLLALAATLVNAQDDEQSYVHGLVETLTNASLTSLAYSIGNLSLDGTSGQLLSTISDQSKNFTFFAPSNDGCKPTLFCLRFLLRLNSIVRL